MANKKEQAKPWSRNPRQLYAVYKGEELLQVGTLWQIAQARGIKITTARYYLTDAYKRKIPTDKPTKRLTLTPLEE